MEILFERHLEYLSDVPTSFERELMKTIDYLKAVLENIPTK